MHVNAAPFRVCTSRRTVIGVAVFAVVTAFFLGASWCGTTISPTIFSCPSRLVANSEYWDANAARIEAFAAHGARFVTARSWQTLSSMPPPVFLVTMAKIPGSQFTAQDQATREYEYMIGLNYVFSKTFRTAVVISESDSAPWPLADAWPWSVQLYMSATALSSKSQKESACVQALIHEVRAKMDPPVTNDTWVIKMSGRYQVVRDDLLWAALKTPDADMIADYVPVSDSIHTFFFAMKWGHFQELYVTLDINALATLSIEIHTLAWARARKLHILHIPKLYVVSNIGAYNTIEFW